MQRIFDTTEPTSLYVEIGSGDVTVHADEAVQTVVVTVEGRGAEDVIVEQRGEQIVVVAPRQRTGFFGGGQGLSVEITTPLDSDLATKLGSADLEVTGRLCDARLKSGSGDVQIESLSGDALVETGSGDITIESILGDLRTKSGSGDVEVGDLQGRTSISTGSGDVDLGRTTDDVQVKAGSGDLHVKEVNGDVSLNTASGSLDIERMTRGSLQASNVSGDITVGIPAGIPVWTDISAVSGEISSSLDGAGEPQEGQDFIEVRAKTVSGDIHLHQL